MTFNEAVKLLESCKSKKNGIDSDTKKKIKDALYYADIPFHYPKVAELVLHSNDNDYFVKEEIARVIVDEALKVDDHEVYGNLFKVVLDNGYGKGLHDPELARKIAQDYLNKFDLDMYSKVLLVWRLGEEETGSLRDLADKIAKEVLAQYEADEYMKKMIYDEMDSELVEAIKKKLS